LELQTPTSWQACIGHTAAWARVDPGVRRDDGFFSTACVQARQHLSFPRTALGVRRNDGVMAGGQQGIHS
jgi:hypothetical protein